MGVQVRLPTMLRKHVAGQSVIQAGGGTVGSLLTELGQHYPGLHTDLTGPDGELHQFINIYVNDEDIRYLDGWARRSVPVTLSRSCRRWPEGAPAAKGAGRSVFRRKLYGIMDGGLHTLHRESVRPW